MKHFQPALKSIRQLYPVIDGVMLTAPEKCEVGGGERMERRIAAIRIMSMWRRLISLKKRHSWICFACLLDNGKVLFLWKKGMSCR